MNYFKEVKEEMKKVSWPSLTDVTHFTWISISFVIAFALYFALTDDVFSRLIEWFVNL